MQDYFIHITTAIICKIKQQFFNYQLPPNLAAVFNILAELKKFITEKESIESKKPEKTQAKLLSIAKKSWILKTKLIFKSVLKNFFRHENDEYASFATSFLNSMKKDLDLILKAIYPNAEEVDAYFRLPTAASQQITLFKPALPPKSQGLGETMAKLAVPILTH